MNSVAGFCRYTLLVFFLIGVVPATVSASQVPVVGGVPTLAPLLDKVTPAVVNIAVKSKAPVQQNPLLRDPFFRFFFDIPEQQQAPPQMAAGSGVIIDADKGYVLTNHHVIENADEIVVTLKDRRSFKAELVGSDKGTDIALLKIAPEKLAVLPFGDSDALRVGDYVVAIGNPFGIGQTVTSGIVSALGRSGLNIEGYEDFIQTDASINPGNSGGALINLKGELIGINTAIIGPAGGNVGIGFAIPSRMVRAVMAQLIRYGEVRRGMLGIAIQDVTPDIAVALTLPEARGAIITRVEPGSSAEKAGLKAGDVVISVNNVALRDSSDLRNRVGLVPIGEEIDLGILHEGKQSTVRVRIVGGDTKARVSSLEGAPQFEGAGIENLRRGHPLYGRVSGVLVAEIEPGSPAWRNGLRKGDVIVAVNRRKVKNVAGFQSAVRAGAGAGVLAMQVIRDGVSLILMIE